jgi:hypothetical protein
VRPAAIQPRPQSHLASMGPRSMTSVPTDSIPNSRPLCGFNGAGVHNPGETKSKLKSSIPFPSFNGAEGLTSVLSRFAQPVAARERASMGPEFNTPVRQHTEVLVPPARRFSGVANLGVTGGYLRASAVFHHHATAVPFLWRLPELV